MNEEELQKEENKESEEIISEVIKKERDEYLEGWKRAKADLLNYKKEETERTRSILQYANEGLVRECIHVLDSFDLGITTLKDDDPAQKGMRLIKTQLEDILKKHGLQPIESAKGKQFNPEVHEAVSEIAGEDPPGTVVDEVERGYKLYEKTIRPTRVILSKGKGHKE